MKLLFIGHTYIVKVNRQKLSELAKTPEIELFLIIPRSWPHPLFKYRHKAEIKGDEPFQIFALKTILEGLEGKYSYIRLGTILKKIKPDIIQVEQGANALSYFQALMLRNFLSSHAKALFFTWMNIPYYNGPFFSLIEKFNLKNSAGAICGNKGAREVLRKKGFGKPIKIIPQIGVDTEIFKKLDMSNLKKRLGLNSFIIGYVGRLVKRKGLITLVHSLEKIKKDWQLLLVGRGDLREEIIRLSDILGIRERGIIVDSVPHSRVMEYINCMDVLVLPSLKEQYEQFGHVLIEAMACEVPVIGSTSGEIPNVIGDAGLIFEQGNVDDLYQKLLLIMENERLRRDLAKKGRQRVLEKYTHKKIAEELYGFYKMLLFGRD